MTHTKEGHTVELPIKGWVAKAFGSGLVNEKGEYVIETSWHILDDKKKLAGILSTLYPTLRIYVTSPQYVNDVFDAEYYEEKFTGTLENAARYLFLKRQKPLKENTTSLVFPIGKIVKFPDIHNWGARKYQNSDMNIMRIDILSDENKFMGALIFNDITEESNLMYDSNEDGTYDRFKYEQPWDFDNVKNAVRYVFLQSQKNRIVDEVKSNGYGDLMNYYNENPPALNNDYVDNFKYAEDYFIKEVRSLLKKYLQI